MVRLASMLGCRVFEHEAMFLEPGTAGAPSTAGVSVGFEAFYRWFEETKQQTVIQPLVDIVWRLYGGAKGLVMWY